MSYTQQDVNDLVDLELALLPVESLLQHAMKLYLSLDMDTPRLAEVGSDLVDVRNRLKHALDTVREETIRIRQRVESEK